MYRIGYKENLIGDSWHCLEKKTWWGWKTILNGEKRNVVDVARQLKEKGEIVINVNLTL
jgi:hypothetical protein